MLGFGLNEHAKWLLGRDALLPHYQAIDLVQIFSNLLLLDRHFIRIRGSDELVLGLASREPASDLFPHFLKRFIKRDIANRHFERGGLLVAIGVTDYVTPTVDYPLFCVFFINVDRHATHCETAGGGVHDLRPAERMAEWWVDR